MHSPRPPEGYFAKAQEVEPLNKERARLSQAAQELIHDHAQRAAEAEAIAMSARRSRDPVCAREAQAIADKHDAMVEQLFYEAGRVELAYEEKVREFESLQMMRQLKTSLESKKAEYLKILDARRPQTAVGEADQEVRMMKQLRDSLAGKCARMREQLKQQSLTPSSSAESTPQPPQRTPTGKNPYLLTEEDVGIVAEKKPSSSTPPSSVQTAKVREVDEIPRARGLLANSELRDLEAELQEISLDFHY